MGDLLSLKHYSQLRERGFPVAWQEKEPCNFTLLRRYSKDAHNWNPLDDRPNLRPLGVKIPTLNNGIEVKILNKSFLTLHSVNSPFRRIYSLISWGYLTDSLCLRMRAKTNAISQKVSLFGYLYFILPRVTDLSPRSPSFSRFPELGIWTKIDNWNRGEGCVQKFCSQWNYIKRNTKNTCLQ